MTVHEKALKYLYREQRYAKQAYGQAERREGVTQEELGNLSVKLEALDYCITLVLASDEAPLPVTILERALVEVKHMCEERDLCEGCPFAVKRYRNFYSCCITSPNEDETTPEHWYLDDWKERGKDDL